MADSRAPGTGATGTLDRAAHRDGHSDAPVVSDRGRLVIHDRVVETIATVAACEVDAITRTGGTLEGVVGRRYPKVDARTAGTRTRIRVEVAVTWPAALPTVLPAVRDRVRDRVQTLTGLDVDAVDVLAAKIVHPDPDDERPRRVS